MRRAQRDPAPRRRNFYAGAFDGADQELLWQAAQIDGIEDEIAALRLVLRKHLCDRPETYDVMLKNVDSLLRAVSAKYRMSPKNAQDFAERMTATLRDLGEQIAPGLMGMDNDV
ncbi:MAG: hypothetical protein WD359_06770 [Dehalococcoidia bacterium]